MSLHVTPQERRTRSAILHEHKAAMPRRIPRAKRQRIKEAIQTYLDQADQLIRVLDLHDGDRDLEEDRSDYEMTNGGCGGGIGHITAAGLFMDDLEDDRTDDEPSLAHTLDVNQSTAQRNIDERNLRMPRGISWAWANSDLEQEHDGREDGHDREQVCEDEGADEHYANNGSGRGAM